MCLRETTAQFRYEDGLSNLGIVGKDALWAKLQAASKERHDLEEAQMIHDMSWVLTQMKDAQRKELARVRDAIEEALHEDFGTFVWTFCEDLGNDLEGFILPLAKLSSGEDAVVAGTLLQLLGSGGLAFSELPEAEFAAAFARDWLLNTIGVADMSEAEAPAHARGARVLLGWRKGCGHCSGRGIAERRFHDFIRQAQERATKEARRPLGHRRPRADDVMVVRLTEFLRSTNGCHTCGGSGIDEARLQAKVLEGGVGIEDLLEDVPGGYRVDLAAAKARFGDEIACAQCGGCGMEGTNWQAALETPLPGDQAKTVRDLLAAMAPGEGLGSKDLWRLFGESVICSECSGWLNVPADARTGWLCPVENSHGERDKSWRKLVIV